MEKEILEQGLREASRRETCWPGCADGWSSENPAWGHCVMYTLFMHQVSGGDIVYVDAVLPDGGIVPHYFNRIDGTDYDFSRSQFCGPIEFRNRKIVSREDVLALPDREVERYEQFQRRAMRALLG